MAFASGTVTFKRFFVQGELLDRADEDLISRLADNAIDRAGLQTADHTWFGWSTGDHILDTRFDFAKNVVADGLHFAMRVDTNKPPTDLVRSYQRINEQSMLEASGREFLSKAEKREAREQARSRADSEAQAGTFRRMKQIPVFWDFRRNEVYLGGAASNVVDHFMLLFQQTFDRSLTAGSSGELAARWAQRTGENAAYDQCRPACFINPPDGAEIQDELLNPAEGRSHDFLGTEWLTWLWYATQVESPDITTGQGHPVTVLFEKTMQMECAFKVTGNLGVTADNPIRLAESPVALATGKRPVKTGLQLAVQGDAFGLTVRGDAMNFSGVMLPPPEDTKSPRELFEERMDHLRHLIEAMDTLYVAFLKRRLTSKWSQTLTAMRNWIAAGHHATGHEPAALSAAS